MKKLFVALLAILLVFSLVACNGKKEISLNALESELKELETSLAFELKENGSGYSFEYNQDLFTNKVKYSGTVDKNKNIVSFTAIRENTSIDIVSDKYKMEQAISKFSQNKTSSITLGEAMAARSFYDLVSVYDTLGKSDASVEEVLDIFCVGGSATIEGWNVSVTITKSSVAITMY